MKSHPEPTKKLKLGGLKTSLLKEESEFPPTHMGSHLYAELSTLLGELGWDGVEVTVDLIHAVPEFRLVLTARASTDATPLPLVSIAHIEDKQAEQAEVEESDSYNVDMMVNDMEEATKKAIQDELFITPHDQTYAAPGSVVDMVRELHEFLLMHPSTPEMSPLQHLQAVATFLFTSKNYAPDTKALAHLKVRIADEMTELEKLSEPVAEDDVIHDQLQLAFEDDSEFF